MCIYINIYHYYGRKWYFDDLKTTKNKRYYWKKKKKKKYIIWLADRIKLNYYKWPILKKIKSDNVTRTIKNKTTERVHRLGVAE